MVAMTEPRDPPPPTGCAMFGIYSGMFRRRRSASMTSLHRINGASSDADAEAPNAAPAPANPVHHRKAVVHHDSSSLVRRPNAMPVPAAQNGAVARAAAPAANDRSKPATKAANGVGVGPRPAVEPAAEYTGMAAELDKMILDHQRVKGTTQLVRATSGNMMLHRNLGNLNAGAGGGAPARNSVERGAKAANERKAPNGYAFSGMGNIVKEPRPAAGGELCRALSHRIDPEKLKEMGNEEYRQGHYTEAVALYDQAIIMDHPPPIQPLRRAQRSPRHLATSVKSPSHAGPRDASPHVRFRCLGHSAGSPCAELTCLPLPRLATLPPLPPPLLLASLTAGQGQQPQATPVITPSARGWGVPRRSGEAARQLTP